jgi:hypothetical protein
MGFLEIFRFDPVIGGFPIDPPLFCGPQVAQKPGGVSCCAGREARCAASVWKTRILVFSIYAAATWPCLGGCGVGSGRCLFRLFKRYGKGFLNALIRVLY